MKWKTDSAYLADVYIKFNSVNLQLQGHSLNSTKTKSILSAFLARVKLLDGATFTISPIHHRQTARKTRGSTQNRKTEEGVYDTSEFGKLWSYHNVR
nr:unnamed protein product [Callosobruchus analis]